MNPATSDLPAFLVAEGGLHSGLMMAQVAAASLVSECKTLAHPASVDSIPTSADREDHVSMSPIAARKLAAIVVNLERVLAIELVTAFQAMEFLRPLSSSKPIEQVRRAFRRVVKPWNTGPGAFGLDLDRAHAFLDSDVGPGGRGLSEVAVYTLSVPTTTAGPRTVRAATGSQLRCLGWPQEAALRMLENNLDPNVAEKPDELIVYGGTGAPPATGSASRRSWRR